MPENTNTNTLQSLYNIVNDLWGEINQLSTDIQSAPSPVPDPALMGAQSRAIEAVTEAPAQTAPEEAKAEETKPEEPAPIFPDFEEIWHIADETLDWTNALSGIPNPDMDEETWRFCCELAPRVLDGDTDAYSEVLTRMRPLGDLLPYARAFRVKSEGSDALTVTFEGLSRYMKGTESENRRYLCAMSLRVARDLFALLPVSRITVTARADEKDAIQVSFDRRSIQKVRFAFVDPVALCESFGGTFADA